MMLGMNTRMIDSPPGVIYHTPIRELFRPMASERTFFAGSNVPDMGQIPEESFEDKELVEKILTVAAELFPTLPKDSLRLTTRTLRGYPITNWQSSSTVGQGPSRSVPTTHCALVFVVPTERTVADQYIGNFQRLQPYNHIHDPRQHVSDPRRGPMSRRNGAISTEPDAEEEARLAEEALGPVLLCLHMGSVPGKDEDEWVLTDLLKDLKRGWKKSIITVGDRSQRVWVDFRDGSRLVPVDSYNNMAARPFADRTVDL